MPKKAAKKFHLAGSSVSLLFTYLLQVKTKEIREALVVTEISVEALCRQSGLEEAEEALTEISLVAAVDSVDSEAEASEAAVPAEAGDSHKPGKPGQVSSGSW